MPVAARRPGERDCRGHQIFLFGKESVAKYDSSVKGQTRFGAIPTDEFVDGMTVGFLRAGSTEGVKHGSLRLLQIGQSKNRLSLGAFRSVVMDHTSGLLSRSQYGHSHGCYIVSKIVSGQLPDDQLVGVVEEIGPGRQKGWAAEPAVPVKISPEAGGCLVATALSVK